eukprot:CAMPEP_0175819164 /NCGR_PEP_ID=MMETSP0107_2-20121207/7926_1 /TAXON_ID=195067 ORGANISM="Goniomonas pacifica, Strain CCMP1869" /NCGR_SAMPLE_ID=MMETSP0107_2 /ASSEMBLY_ACC=CAM_ASM_000203 /LENGTH=357 /DNA_ID=CAMNT_0017131399 /DNA_START=367 /DNA_END=1440 /DNA_ORIENTATION=+
MSRGSLSFAALMVADLAYSTVLQTSFRLLSCNQLEGTLVLRASGDTRCFQTWQYGIMVVVVALIAYPFAILLLVHRTGHMPSITRYDFRAGVIDALCASFKRNFRWWGAVPPFRRLLINLIFTFVDNAMASTSVIFLINFAALLVNTRVQPHALPGVQAIDDAVLTLLTLLSACDIGLSVADVLAVETSDNLMPLVVLSLVVCLVPLCTTVVLSALCTLSRPRTIASRFLFGRDALLDKTTENSLAADAGEMQSEGGRCVEHVDEVLGRRTGVMEQSIVMEHHMVPTWNATTPATGASVGGTHEFCPTALTMACAPELRHHLLSCGWCAEVIATTRDKYHSQRTDAVDAAPGAYIMC